MRNATRSAAPARLAAGYPRRRPDLTRFFAASSHVLAFRPGAGTPKVVVRSCGSSHPTTGPPALAEAGDETALPGRLDGASRVVLADVGDSLVVRNSVEDGKARERGAGASKSTAAGDLDSLGLGPRPGVAERVRRRARIGREPEVRPSKPTELPGHRRRLASEQVERVRRLRARRERPPQPPSANEPARGQPQNAGRRGIPGFGHVAEPRALPPMSFRRRPRLP
jgi:hypothetical protein